MKLGKTLKFLAVLQILAGAWSVLVLWLLIPVYLSTEEPLVPHAVLLAFSSIAAGAMLWVRPAVGTVLSLLVQVPQAMSIAVGLLTSGLCLIPCFGLEMTFPGMQEQLIGVRTFFSLLDSVLVLKAGQNLAGIGIGLNLHSIGIIL
ncbi:hypothetical protein [Dokdonella sp.]|uniref:hypothetical protein n=1 Tax=Dokdonella sp. TaxID=2291710 RepID=UPI0035273FC9